MTHVEDAQAG